MFDKNGPGCLTGIGQLAGSIIGGMIAWDWVSPRGFGEFILFVLAWCLVGGILVLGATLIFGLIESFFRGD